MATLPDACRPLKLESPAEGGTQLNIWPTEVDPSQDALTAAGLYVQNAANSATDKTTLISRGTSGLTLTDNNTSRALKELVTNVSGQVASHNALPDLIHFLPDGPGDGFASGAVQTVGYSGPLLTSRVWWTNSTLTQRIYSEVYAYNGPLLATATYTVYDAKGTQVRQAVDSFSYTGPVCTSISRTWS